MDDESKQSVDFSNFMIDHAEEIVIAGIGATLFLTYKLTQRLISEAIFKANVKTIKYIYKNYMPQRFV